MHTFYIIFKLQVIGYLKEHNFKETPPSGIMVAVNPEVLLS